MTRHNPTEDRLVCSNCNKDTFAVRRENGLEVKYGDRWMMVLNDSAGTILFRCRFCGSVMVHCLGAGTVAGTSLQTQIAADDQSAAFGKQVLCT